MERNSSNMGLLTAGLGMIAVGTIGPFALLLLGMLAMLSGSMAVMIASAGVGLLALWGLVILGVVGQILCLFAPLRQNTKIGLGVSLLCIGLSYVFNTQILGLISLIGFLVFLYGVCADLESQDLTGKFNQSAMFGLLCFAGTFFSTMAMALVGPLALLGMVVSFLFGALAFARYAQTIVDLAMRANKLRSQLG